jgi:hypothetical protein
MVDATLPKLGKREFEALVECVDMTSRGYLYFWREASMKKLAAHGFVELRPNEHAARSWVPTEAGRTALSARQP